MNGKTILSGIFKTTNRVALLFFVLSIFGNSSEPFAGQRSGNSPVITTAFDKERGEWNIGWEGRVAQYDLVYYSPPADPLQGIPLGNGETGVLFWCEGSKLIAAVNKSDLWDDAPFGRFHNWKREEEEYSTTQRHAFRIIFDFAFPVFDSIYLSEFYARLNLSDASMTLRAGSPFGAISLKAFVDKETGILFCDFSCDYAENIPITIALERFGSRTFSHWYSLVNRDASIGLAGTEASADAHMAYLTHSLTSGVFAAGGTVLNGGGATAHYAREHSRRSSITLSGEAKKEAKLAFAVTSPRNGNPAAELTEIFSAVRKRGVEAYRAGHEEQWQSFWRRSFMDYGDDYLNALWHLTMYYSNTSQGGKYPGRFNNGLWSWNRDVQNWNFYFHWNQQQLYWHLNAAGHHELVLPYLDLRYRGLPHAKADARELFSADGAFVSDVTDRRGYNSLSELENHTPVAEIALDFWRQYRYTGDEEFLKTKALPYILEAAQFFGSRFQKESDGLYHAVEGTGYEGWIKMRDSLTELVYARALFSTAIDALTSANTDHPSAELWKDILKNCAPLPIVKAGGESITKEGEAYKYARGIFAGKGAPTDEILASGWGIKEEKILTARVPADEDDLYGFKIYDGIFPTVPSSPVYPSGLIGLAQKGTRLFDAMTATTVLYAPEVAGWDPVTIVMARLGLGEELAALLERFPQRWQIYSNGWGHWGPGENMRKEADEYFKTNIVRDAAFPADVAEKFPFPMWQFRQMSMESMSVLATAMNESILQSYDGTLRVAPAFVKNKRGRFTLHAEGGFIVSSEIAEGEAQWIFIKSASGGVCRVSNPWRQAFLQLNGANGEESTGEKIIGVEMNPGDTLLLTPQRMEAGIWMCAPETPSPNKSVRVHPSGNAVIGIPRMY